MQEPQTPPTQNAGPPPAEHIRPAGLFSDLKYPAPLAPPPPTPPVTKANKSLARAIPLLVVLVVAVAALAWVSQFLPGRVRTPDTVIPTSKPRLDFVNGTYYHWPPRPGEKPAAAPAKKGKLVPKKIAPEDGETPQYLGEYETVTNGRQDGGFCDYEFKNGTGQPIALSLLDTYCQCSSVEVALLGAAELAAYHDKKGKPLVPHGTRYGSGVDDFTWTQLKRTKTEDGKPVLVEPGQRGLIRLHWDGRGQEKTKALRLYANMQMTPRDNPQAGVVQQLRVEVNYVEPVRVEPPTLPPVAFVQGNGASADFTLNVWSATRDLVVEPDLSEPCLTVTVTPLQEAECLELEKTLAKDRSLMTRVRSAYRIGVLLHEKKDGRQLSLGTFEKSLPVRFKDKESGEVLPTGALPVLTGTVRGDLKIDGSWDNIKIDLGNFGARVAPKVVKLWTKPDIELQAYPVLEPRVAGITADVRKAKAGNPGDWEVTLTVSDNVVSGPLPRNLVLVLRLKDSAQTIRIPVVGHRSYR